MRAYSNFHPAVLLCQFISILLTVMFTFNPVIQITSVIGAVLCMITIGQADKLKKNLKYYMIIFIIVCLTNPLFSQYGQTILIKYKFIVITFESLMYGAGLGINIIGVIIWCQAYSFMISTEKYMALFKGKSPKISLILAVTLRYIPMLRRRWKEILNTQRALGMYPTKKDLKKVKFFLSCFLALMSWSFESAADTTNSILSRSCKDAKKTNYIFYKIKKSDIFLMIIYAFMLLLFGFFALKGCIDFEYYPIIKAQNINIEVIAAFTSFCILIFSPSLIELKEALAWKYYRSKI